MNHFLNALKIITLIAFLAACVVGYRFASVWQTDDAAHVTSATWSKDSIMLGESATLTLDIKAPWHRDISSAIPSEYPNALILRTGKEVLKKGNLDWSGHRHWQIQCSLVAVSSEIQDGAKISFPMISTRRMKNNGVSTLLPDLTIQMPEETPSKPINNFSELEPALAIIPDASALTPTVETPSKIWLIIAAVMGAIAIAYFIYLYTTRQRPDTPPWEIALAQLEKLQQSPPESKETFYIHLTDIIKEYTTQRFRFNANAESSAEYIGSLHKINDLGPNHRNSLTSIIREADTVKFAGGTPNSEITDQSIHNAREFIQATTPEQSS